MQQCNSFWSGWSLSSYMSSTTLLIVTAGARAIKRYILVFDVKVLLAVSWDACILRKANPCVVGGWVLSFCSDRRLVENIASRWTSQHQCWIRGEQCLSQRQFWRLTIVDWQIDMKKPTFTSCTNHSHSTQLYWISTWYGFRTLFRFIVTTRIRSLTSIISMCVVLRASSKDRFQWVILRDAYCDVTSLISGSRRPKHYCL